MEKQKTFSKSKKVLMFCLISVFTLMCAGGGAIHWLNNERSSINATQNTDTTSYVSVGEIWNESTGQFDGNNLTTLLQYITGNSSITSLNVTSRGSIGQTKSAADIRDIQLNAGNTYQYTDEDTQETITTGQDVQVTFGGLTWQVVHLTQDRSRNDIVTLWLSNNYQQAWEGRSATEGEFYGFVDGALYSDWSADWYSSSNSVPYPSGMYGQSYINAVTLNNGGTYATSTSALATATQSTDSVFAMFTMEEVVGNVTSYLVTPSEVAYQETEDANTQFGSRDYLPNEAYGTPGGSGKWFVGHDYSSKTGYTNWANNYLWLPSYTEAYTNGIWETSTTQRANNSGSDNLINTGVGSSNSDNGTYVQNYSWLRSSASTSASDEYILNASGSDFSYGGINRSLAVRPALHLNLNSAALTTDPTIWNGSKTEAPSLQDPSQPNSEDNPYIIDSAAKLAWISANYNQSNCYGQHYLQTVDIDLADHPWTPINNASSRRAYFYDGGGHTISNLYINTSEQTLASNNYLGLFGCVWGSSSNHCYIKNLGIVNGSIAGEGSRYVGAVVGYARYTDITNCYNEKTDITMTGSSEYVGGVAGYNENGTISGSYNTGTVSGERYVGGVVGYNNSGTIIGSYNDGDITGTSNYVGGVAGYSSRGSITSSYNTGDVTGDGDYVGGVVGYNNSGTISGSYNTGTVSGDYYVGGVVGLNFETISGSYNTGTVSGGSHVGGVAGHNSGTISGSYNTGTVSGRNNVGGVAGQNSEGTISGSYNTGEITGTGYVGGVVGNNNIGGTISGSYNTGSVSGLGQVGGVAGSVSGSSDLPAVISSCFSTGAVTRTSGSSTRFGGVVGYIENITIYPSQYVSISWCYYNTETVGSVVTKAIGRGTGYQCYGLTTAQMQGDKDQNYMYLSDTVWNFASGQYPTLKYVATAQN